MTGAAWRELRLSAGVQPHDLGLDPVTVWRIEQRTGVKRLHVLALERACQLAESAWADRLASMGLA